MSDEDFYTFLGVSNNASADEIKHAYRKRAIELHPDTSNNKDGEAFKKLLLIYTILSDPNQRQSYDAGRAYKGHYAHDKKESKHKKTEEPPEDFDSAVYVSDIKVKDSYGKISLIKTGDYIFYPVNVNKKILFYKYTGKDYYRVRVGKVYSIKRNNFRKIPLFKVQVGDFEHVIFLRDFYRHWLSQNGYKDRERHKAVVTFAVEISLVVIAVYLVLKI